MSTIVEVDDLRSRLAEAQLRCEELEKKHKALLGEASPSTDGKTISYLEFRILVLAKIGKTIGNEQGWRSTFLNGCGGKYNDGALTRWRKTGLVPIDAVHAIDTLDLSKLPTGQVWTTEEKNILINEYLIVDADGKVKLVNKRKIAEVAADLTKRFGRVINENCIKSKMNSYRLSLKPTVVPEVVTADFTPKQETLPSEEDNGLASTA